MEKLRYIQYVYMAKYMFLVHMCFACLRCTYWTSYTPCMDIYSCSVCLPVLLISIQAPANELRYTQAEVTRRDAIIRQLEEKCEQLEAQVSPAIYFEFDTVGYVMVCS